VQSGDYDGPDGSGNDTSSETALVGERVRLRCIVHAIPDPQVTWYKDGDELRLDGAAAADKYLLSRDGRQLEITVASVDDAARYTCVARNVAGTVDKHFDLDVYGKLPLRRITLTAAFHDADTDSDSLDTPASFMSDTRDFLKSFLW